MVLGLGNDPYLFPGSTSLSTSTSQRYSSMSADDCPACVGMCARP